MRNCAFLFGDTYWQQLNGTAMGTAPAPPYATIYFGIYEKKFLGRYRGTILLYRRFLDDVIAILLYSISIAVAGSLFAQDDAMPPVRLRLIPHQYVAKPAAL